MSLPGCFTPLPPASQSAQNNFLSRRSRQIYLSRTIPVVIHRINKFHAIMENGKYINVTTSVCNWSLSRERSIKFTSSQPISTKSITILQSQLVSSHEIYKPIFHAYFCVTWCISCLFISYHYQARLLQYYKKYVIVAQSLGIWEGALFSFP
jgi:hypothetical protein